MNNKVDFKKELKPFYNPSKKGIHILTIPKMNFIMLDGTGNPNTSMEYQQTVEALYTMAYGLKFALKPLGYDYIVPPLEGLWWMDDMSEFTQANKDRWLWTMMIMQPEWITPEQVEKVRSDSIKKKGNSLLKQVRFEPFEEGQAVQILYTGAYSNEAPTIAEMHKFILANGLKPYGRHHEIYLGDPRKTSPERLQTILRQPVRAKGSTPIK